MKASELIRHLKSYIDITGEDCEVAVFDRAEGISHIIKTISIDGNFVFLHISSNEHIEKESI